MKRLKKVFFIDGGAGRVIAALPALEKYVTEHPEEDVKIVIAGWDMLAWGNKILQDITYSADTKGLFDNFIKDADIVITPEPYKIPGYFRQELSLAEAFNYEINNTSDHSQLSIPKLYTSKAEEKNAANVLADVKSQFKKDITIIFQPFGRSARVDRGDIIDDSTRGLGSDAYLKLVKKLSSKYNVILFAEKQFFLQEDTYTFKIEADLRMWMSLIDASDYFLGCDSVGQHMARSFNKPGFIILGSTFAKNVTYPDWFTIFEKPNVTKKYSPIRITGFDGHLADRYNDTLLDFSEKEIDDLFNLITIDVEKKVKK